MAELTKAEAEALIAELRAERDAARAEAAKFKAEGIKDVIRIGGQNGDLFRVPLDPTEKRERPDTVVSSPRMPRPQTDASRAALEFAAAQAMGTVT